mmetsp:Transcript_66827/g.178651  ORF Transcript_66827/g.178651 Transcript_66827/m.178651 type:complete len:164 (-) Transcript_66827:1129-1620(-)
MVRSGNNVHSVVGSVRLNVNLKVATCAELVSQKKSSHLQSFNLLVDELVRELTELAEGPSATERCLNDPDCKPKYLVEKIEGDCRAILKEHEKLSADKYLDDAVYRSLVSEALEVKEAGRDKFLLWLHGAEEALLIKSRLLRAAQRERAMTRARKAIRGHVSR